MALKSLVGRQRKVQRGGHGEQDTWSKERREGGDNSFLGGAAIVLIEHQKARATV